jgi:DNA-binding NarL/FixJ family response regulator
MIRLGIIEDNGVIRQSLVDYFRDDTEIRVITTATHVDEFYRNAKEVPQVLLLDLNLPHRNGMDCITELCGKYEGVSIIIHSVADDYESIFKCLCNGAQSYLTKGESLDKVKETILTTFNGGSLMSVEIARKVVDYFSQKRQPLPDIHPEDHGLNTRESEVVRLIVDGNSYKMVAAELNVSINTVRKYIKSIYRKLNINTSMELANIYLKGK